MARRFAVPSRVARRRHGRRHSRDQTGNGKTCRAQRNSRSTCCKFHCKCRDKSHEFDRDSFGSRFGSSPVEHRIAASKRLLGPLAGSSLGVRRHEALAGVQIVLAGFVDNSEEPRALRF